MHKEFPTESSPGNEHTHESNGVVYDVYKLIAEGASLSPSQMFVDEFEAIMKDECWNDSDGRRITPEQVIDAIRESGMQYDFARYAHPKLSYHIKQIESANLNYPILLADNGELLDGMHRLARARLDGHATIDAKTLTSAELEKSKLRRLH